MPKMHLKIRGYTDSACGPFTKNKERIQKFKETGGTKYIYRNELDKAWLQHDTAKNKILILLKIKNMVDIKRTCFFGLQIF